MALFGRTTAEYCEHAGVALSLFENIKPQEQL